MDTDKKVKNMAMPHTAAKVRGIKKNRGTTNVNSSMEEKLDQIIATAPVLECKEGIVVLDYDNPVHKRWMEEAAD